ncbi:hypothetical protein DENSPDRAFT_872760 [Dentipellis sp. KUC8613]|nr:hypothetical protein DENSPDRAFT_872760 [Dentipellis sp. KUC8613]
MAAIASAAPVGTTPLSLEPSGALNSTQRQELGHFINALYDRKAFKVDISLCNTQSDVLTSLPISSHTGAVQQPGQKASGLLGFVGAFRRRSGSKRDAASDTPELTNSSITDFGSTVLNSTELAEELSFTGAKSFDVAKPARNSTSTTDTTLSSARPSPTGATVDPDTPRKANPGQSHSPDGNPQHGAKLGPSKGPTNSTQPPENVRPGAFDPASLEIIGFRRRFRSERNA